MTAPLIERLERACLGGCTCGTKRPELEYHNELCHYRLFSEAAERLRVGQSMLDRAKERGELTEEERAAALGASALPAIAQKRLLEQALPFLRGHVQAGGMVQAIEKHLGTSDDTGKDNSGT